MDASVTLLVSLQALGAALGVVSAIRAEFAYVRAMRDGHLDRAERYHLDALKQGLTFGMTLLLLSSLGLIVAAYLADTPLQPGLTSGYWSFVALALLIISLAWALSRDRISFSLGSAAIFTGWWFLMYMAIGRFPLDSFGATAFLYIVATGVLYAILRLVRLLMTPAERRAADLA